MRDAIRNNWSTTGQELGKELRQFWQASRPGSPARMNSYEENNKSTGSLTSPTALSHLSRRLEIPRPDSPGVGGSDFATGYSLGLIGGVRSWVSHLDLLLEFNINKYADDQKSSIQYEQPEWQRQQ
jgi:choline-phosphate cytidylyltransferase